MEKFEALKQAKKTNPHLPKGFWGADQPKCPHCGAELDIGENDWWRLYEEGEHEVACPLCDGDFTVTTRVSYSFSTENQEGA